MAKRRFKPGGTSVGFRPVGQGLQASRREIQAQAQINIDALKLAKEQHKEASNINISGLANKAKFEEGILGEKQKLEGAVRKRQYEALSIKADRDVDRLKGEAEEAKKYADHWAQLAPKAAKAAGKLAKGLYDFSENIEAKNLNEAYRKTRQQSLADFYKDEATQKLYQQHLKEYDKIDTLAEQSAFYRSFTGNDNYIAAGIVAQDLRKNSAFWKSEGENYIQAKLKSDKSGESFHTKNTAVSNYVDAGYVFLAQHGIDPSSRGGREILGIWEKWGTLEQQRLINEDNANTTQIDLQDASRRLASLKSNTDGTPTPQQITIMKEIQNYVRLGTFSDGKGGYSVGTTNKADIVERSFSIYMDRQGALYNDPEQVREFINKFPIIGDELKGDKAKSFCSVHEARCDRVVEAWTNGNKRRIKGQEGVVAADNVSEIKGYNSRWDEHQKNKGTEGYTQTDQEFHIKEVRRAVNSTKGDDKYKNHVFRRAELTKDSYTVAGKWATIAEHIENGDKETAAMIFSSYSDDVREKLKPNFKSLMELKYSHGGENDWEAVRKRAHSIHTLAEQGNGTGGKNLSGSGKQSVDLMIERVTNRYNQLMGPGSTMTSQEAMDKAFELEIALYNGGVAEDPRNFPTGDNPYARRRSYFYTADGQRTPTYVYRSGLGNGDDQDVERLDELRAISKHKGGLDKALNDFEKEYKQKPNTDFKVLDRATVHHLSRHGFYTYDQMRLNPRFISPKQVIELRKVAQNLTNNVSMLEGDVGFVVPENIKILAVNTGKTETEVINDILADYGHEERFQPNGQDMYVIKAGERRGPPKTTYEEYGLNLAQSAFSQGVDPMPNEIFAWKNMMVPDVNAEGQREFTTEEGTTVTLPEGSFPSYNPTKLDPRLGALSESLGLTYDPASGSVSDPRAFTEAGGNNYLDWNQMMSMYGLQGLRPSKKHRWDYKTKQYVEVK
tara:strand:+ start:1117 stop:3975 length:2859 start_codon:yes stop_codon:yes gene_type:complete